VDRSEDLIEIDRFSLENPLPLRVWDVSRGARYNGDVEPGLFDVTVEGLEQFDRLGTAGVDIGVEVSLVELI
jgi:hypothetical protein